MRSRTRRSGALVDLEGRTVFVSRAGEAVDVPYQRGLPWQPPGTTERRTIDLTEVFAGVEPSL